MRPYGSTSTPHGEDEGRACSGRAHAALCRPAEPPRPVNHYLDPETVPLVARRATGAEPLGPDPQAVDGLRAQRPPHRPPHRPPAGPVGPVRGSAAVGTRSGRPAAGPRARLRRSTPGSRRLAGSTLAMVCPTHPRWSNPPDAGAYPTPPRPQTQPCRVRTAVPGASADRGAGAVGPWRPAVALGVAALAWRPWSVVVQIGSVDSMLGGMDASYRWIPCLRANRRPSRDVGAGGLPGWPPSG